MEKKLDTDTLNDDAVEDKDQLILAAAAKMMKLYHKRHKIENANDDETSAQSEVERRQCRIDSANLGDIFSRAVVPCLHG